MMKKLLAVITLLAILFFFREQLTDYSSQFFKNSENPLVWTGNRRTRLNSELQNMDFSSSITALQDFENDIQKELKNLQSTDDKRSHSFRRQLICELAVIYKKAAMQYLENGDEELYIKFIAKSQTQLAECADLAKQ